MYISTNRPNKQYDAAFVVGSGGLSPSYNDKEMQYFEDVWASTLAGAVIDKKIEFVFGAGIKPVFELIDSKDKKEEQIQSELKQYDDVLDELKEIDRDLHFQQALVDATTMAKVFGRGVILFEPMEEFVPGARDIEQTPSLPEQLKVLHSRDLGKPMIASDMDWTLEGVEAFNSSKTIPAGSMIYLVNKANSPIRRAMYYGYSELQRVVGAARALQRVLEYDAPEIAQSMWASYGLVIVNTDGKTETDTRTQLNTIKDGMMPGAFNFISGKPKEDVEYIPMDLQAKVADIVQLAETYERMIIGNSAVPGPLLGREEDSNMATLFGKIRLFMAGPVQSDREWLSRIVSAQWYERNIRAIGRADILEKVRVKAEFEPITIESWVDSVDAANKLKSAVPGFPDQAILTLLGLEQFKDELEKSKQEMEAKQQQQQQAMAENNPQAQMAKQKLEIMNTLKERVAKIGGGS